MLRRAAGLAAALVLATAGSAAAADTLLGTVDGVQYWGDTSMPAAPSGAVGAVACPAETEVSGGGFGQNAFSGELNDSSPLGNAGWAVNVMFEGTGTQTLNTYAICTDGKRTFEEADRQLKAGKTQKLKVTCEGGKHVIGGGAVILGSIADARLNSSYPFDSADAGRKPDDGWKARGVNISAGDLSFEAHVICAKQQPKYVRTSGTQPASTTSGYSPFCPDSKQVLSGGVKITGPGTEAVVHDIYPRDSSADGNSVPDDGYLINVGNESGVAKKVTAYAICD